MSTHDPLSARGYLARGDYFDTWQVQVTLAVITSVAVGLIWVALPIPLVPIVLALVLPALLIAVTRPYLVSVVFITTTYFKLPDISPMLAPLNHALSALSILLSFALVWHGVLARTVRPHIVKLQVLLMERVS